MTGALIGAGRAADASADLRVDRRLSGAIEAGEMPKELVIVGPAGTGKTFGTLATIHTLAADIPALRILICRQTRASLTESVLVTYEQEILPADGMGRIAYGVSRRTRQAYRYPNGSEVVLGGLDRPDRILSTAWDLIYVNEAIEAGEDGWDTLSSRVNRPGRPRWLGLLLGDTNPGDPAHWIKRRADEGRLALWDTSHRANPRLHDGTAWTPDGEAYMARLQRLAGTRRKRLLEGLWAAGEGQWFGAFDASVHVSEAAEWNPHLPVHLAVDCGVHTGAVWFQVQGEADAARVNVFADYYSDRLPAHANALAILGVGNDRCGGRVDVGRVDPAGNADNGTGLVISAEYRRAGLILKPWPKFPGCVASGLALVESFVSVDPPQLTIHPRCARLIEAFANYRRKRRGNQWIDEPEDPQHPHEELVDALRSGLLDKFPAGRAVRPKMPTRPIHPHQLFY
jgi:hypothetical protein